MSSPLPTNSPSSPPSAGGKRFRSCWVVGCVAPLWLFTALVFAFMLKGSYGAVLVRWDQPPGVNYKSNDPYTVYVVDESSWWNVFHRKKWGSVRVVKKSLDEQNGYGHYTEYEFHNYHGEDDYFARCSTEWTPEGITISEPTGHTLFVPKKAFIGGR